MLNRREFVKNLGQGALVAGAAGMSLQKLLLAQQPAVRGPKPPQSSEKTDWSEWEIYYPGKYSEQDKGILKAFDAQLEKVNKRGPLDVKALVAGKLKGQPGIVDGYTITAKEMELFARTYLDANPLFWDAAYAAKTKFARPIAHPMLYEPYIFPYLALNSGIGDYMVVSRHNDTHSYYKPYFDGDTVFIVVDEQKYLDITPAGGSYFRTFAMSVSARYFNQKGELVGETGTILQNSFRRHKDPAKRNADSMIVWENPDWWHFRPIHQYTDQDWDQIRGLWKAEQRLGGTTRYWDDVKVGDVLTPAAVGPVLPEVENNIMFGALQWNGELKRDILDEKTFKTMVKNPQGIWVRPEHKDRKPAPKPFEDKEIANRDGRCKISNGVAPKSAVGMLTNWMGDAGWMQRIGWSQMTDLPGYDAVIIPDAPLSAMPKLFDKFPYLDKAPELKGRHDTHPMEGDLYINRGRVTAKYDQGGEHFVDVIWWTESQDRYLLGEGFATIRLPKKV